MQMELWSCIFGKPADELQKSTESGSRYIYNDDDAAADDNDIIERQTSTESGDLGCI